MHTKYNINVLILFGFLTTINIYAQLNSFNDIRENFLNENPQSGNLEIRNDCGGSIDDLIFGTYPVPIQLLIRLKNIF